MSWNLEYESLELPARLFRAAVLDWHNLGPKILPEVLSSGCVLEGDGGVIRQLNFTSVPFGFIKERLDFVDHDKFEAKQNLIEGGELGRKIESASSHFEFVPTGNGGCICKVTATYMVLPGVQPGTEEASAKKVVTALLKAADGYLLANPSAYA